MKITVKLYAQLGTYLPSGTKDNQLKIDIEDGTTVSAVFARFNVPPEHCHLVLVNGAFVPPGRRASYALREDDALAAWPPIAGGSQL